MLNLEIEVKVRHSGKENDIDFAELSIAEQNSLITFLEMERDILKEAPAEPTAGLIQQQCFQQLCLEVFHARQLAYSIHAKTLAR